MTQKVTLDIQRLCLIDEKKQKDMIISTFLFQETQLNEMCENQDERRLND